MFRQAHRPLGGEGAVADVGGRQHQVGGVAVEAMEGDVEIRLLRLGGDAGGGAAAHDVGDDDGGLAGHRQAQALHHQAQAGTGGGGEGGHPTEGAADDHVHRGQFVLGLEQAAADLFQAGRQPLQHLGGRGDGVGGDEAHPAAQGPQAAGLVAAHVPALAAGDGGHGTGGGGGVTGLEAGHRRRGDVGALAAQGRRRLGLQGGEGQAGHGPGGSQGGHVEAATRHGVGHGLQGQFDHPGAAGEDLRRHGAPRRIGEHQALGAQGDFVIEAADVEPVQGHQDVEAIIHAVHRAGTEAHHGRGLTAADLGPGGAGHEAVIAGAGHGGEEDRPGRDGAAAARAGDGDGQPGRLSAEGFLGHVWPWRLGVDKGCS